ncbi:MAG: AMP-dependent synthetase and ligase [Solirubrobacterales bacterium]|nr:AMP-dependent synthetase and ligase [Solirubrobacterales bacterium]
MKPYSDFPTVPALLRARSEARADAVAVTFEGKPCTFGELEQRSASVHAWLAAAGVRPGDRVAVLMRNSLEFFYAWLGIAHAGAVSVPINTSMVGDALAHTLAHSGSVGIIADADLLTAVDAAGSFPELRWRLASGAPASNGMETFAAALEGFAESAPPAPAIDGATPMSVVYTSGTTGMPKGVILPHQSFTNTGAYFTRHLRLGADDRLHTCLPLFHCNAQQCGFMVSMHLGVPFAVNAKFSVSRFWSWIAESQATVSNLMGAMLTLLFKVPPQEGDVRNTLRFIAGAPIPEQLHRPFEERFDLRLIEGYGLTETGTMACINPIDDVRPGTIGLPLEHNELRIVDEHDDELPAETPGQILVRGHIPNSQMLGYFKEPEQTAEACRGGWFHTGDLGKRREDGYFVFLDRMKDTIRRRGENISSFLIEKTVLDYPDVLECAAFGVPSELSEEDVKLVAVVRSGVDLDPQVLVDWCAARMADFMVPRYVEYRDSLPLTETGRVHKFSLRAEGVAQAWDREHGADVARTRG